ncbi:MAG: hypothetical protein IJ546_02290 [Prevotella sp.]|nr:hypothetical protein [Prevotella sp.]
MSYNISLGLLNNTPLYRIMPLSRFEEMIKHRQNTLVKPFLWNDPCESICKHSIVTENNIDYPLDVSHWYGQCWSMCEESALMWQAFAPQIDNRRYVKIMARNEKLTQNLKEESHLQIAVSEKIRYFLDDNNDQEEKVKELINCHRWPKNFLNKGASYRELLPLYPLLTKRILFKHEEEFRLLVFDKASSSDLFNYSFDVNTLVEEIVLDPWTPDDDVEKITNKLRSLLINEDINIKKSTLFSRDISKFCIKFKV